MSIPQYSPTTGRFERPSHKTRSQSIDSTASDFGAFVDASSDPSSATADPLSLFDSTAQLEPSQLAAAAAAAERDEQDFFNAFERAAIEQAQHRPSPPPIDLRSVEAKLGPDVLVPRRTPSHTSNGAGGFASSSAANSPSITRLDASLDNLSNSNQNRDNSSFSFFDLAQLDPHHANPDRPALDPALLEDDPALLKEQLTLRSTPAAPTVRRPITVALKDRHDLTSEVILPWHASHLQAALPPRLRLGHTWKLLYSLDQHGMSLSTLYNNVAKGLDPSRAPRSSGGSDFYAGDSYMRGASAAARGAVGLGSGGGLRKLGGGLSIAEAGLILAVKDADDNIFGAFVNERLRPRTGYYGTGECFLWKTTRQPPSLKAVNPSLEPNRIKTFRWTGRNDYVLLTESSFLSIGSGDNGRYGLWLGNSLERGVSSKCSTFGNDVLCDDEPGGEEQDGGGELAVAEEDERGRDDPFGLFEGGGGVDSDGDEAKFEVMGLEVWAVGID
ncbi:unnamed protein product [Tilletia controversa]|uniref:Oxidation resistance protein 1 n=1 Tax=Tilletia controversa TaxID=13291 RepID=A0A8X7SZG0_9BASI|nr:hypothetical protein CF328_g6973 [Tilletia controversa]KAE8252541.1 hypothetical protein A4X06_0g2116 [Tilletia controversa]CAD6932003.1 unnamed protein product [Tilletia controversa]CAD6979752.1 unnamed protein product [Tilletia controversa]